MLSAEEGARSLLEAEGAIDRLVALIGRPGGGQKQTASALQIMARLVLISDKPLVESALARANRFRGARVGTTLVDLLKYERGELQTCVDAMTLINALVATTPDKRALVSELVSGGPTSRSLGSRSASARRRSWWRWAAAAPASLEAGLGVHAAQKEMEASGRDLPPRRHPRRRRRRSRRCSSVRVASSPAKRPPAAAPHLPPPLAPPDDAAVVRAGNRQHARWRARAAAARAATAPPPPPPPPPPGAPAAPKGPQLRMVHWTRWRRRSSDSPCGKMPTSRAPAVCTTISRLSSYFFEVKAA